MNFGFVNPRPLQAIIPTLLLGSFAPYLVEAAARALPSLLR